MKKSLIYLLFVFVVTTIPLSESYSSDIFIFIMQKQQAKKSRGWSLSDWMATKNKIKMMDMWLALHSSANLFEFYLDTNKGNYKYSDMGQTSTEKIDREHLAHEFGAFISIIGLEGGFLKSNESSSVKNGQVSLRLFGTAMQGTNITASYGIEQRSVYKNEHFQNWYWQIRGSLNLLPFLGVSGLYRDYSYNQYKSSNSKGYLTEYGAYLDAWFMRLYIKAFRKDIKYSKAGVKYQRLRKGYAAGVKLFF